jgi:hypothetical protein
LEFKASRGRYECYAALAQGALQGLAVLDLKTKKTAAGRAITLDYLSTNPANRTVDRGLKHVGAALIAAAIARSQECDAGGTIRLESLPGAIGFYENLGMVRQPRRSTEGNPIYLLDPETAEQLLEEIKRHGIITL